MIPGVIVFIVSLFIGAGPTSGKPASRTKIWKRKLWEWNAGWMGLGLSLAIAFLITDGTKNLVGKPRPDLLGRCNPDLSRLLSSTVGGIGDQVDEGINLVSWTICRNPGSTLDDGFRSFPSGHSSCMSLLGSSHLLEVRLTSHHSLLRGSDISGPVPLRQISYHHSSLELSNSRPQRLQCSFSTQASGCRSHISYRLPSHSYVRCHIRVFDKVLRL